MPAAGKVMDNTELSLLPVALRALPHAIVIVREDGRPLAVSAVCEHLLRWPAGAALPATLSELLPLCDEHSRAGLDWELGRLDDPDWQRELTESAVLQRQDGSEFPFELVVVPLAAGDVRGWLLLLTDLLMTRSLADTVHFQRSHDSLTGLVNRAEFESRLQDLLAQVSASAGHALCYIDVDQFKVINDTCGHVAGDELLRQLTELLRARVAVGDLLARIGGDEFAVLLSRRTLTTANVWADSVREAISQLPFNWGDKTFRLSVSIGVAALTGPDQNWAQVLGQADAACHHAKELGGNQVRLFSADDAQLAQRHTEMQWVSRIVQALQQNRFQLWAQPIVAVAAGSELVHQEILIRMIDVDGTLIAPGHFLPAAERFNLVLMIDRWVVSQTLNWLAARQQQGLPPVRCAINLSGASVNQPPFLDFIESELRRSAVPPDWLCFEVTETAAIANLQRARSFIQTLQSWGCEFALDDFGAGMSSFAYLRNLPVDYLKIDGAFIKELASNAMDQAMVRAINEVAKVAGMKTIAEFVENNEVLAVLGEIGVDYAQGYGIAKPAPLS